ncbi:MAG: serine protein kinase RIO [Candidatus Verstraetearchaeota archaeon]|nr:serine protein kinase RIO [Candidatus Verstraetearchaeota archaeon]
MSEGWEEKFFGKEEKRRKDEDLLKTVEEVFDAFTLQALYKLINKKVIDVLYGVVDTGKESRVYWAKSPQGEDLAVKIFLTSTREFKKTVLQYIDGDPRFEKMRRDTRHIVYAWALKEFKNLERAYEVGVSVPRPIAVHKNIIVMTFIGENGVPAPLLKDAEVSDYEEMFWRVVDNIKALYRKAKIVHADLSEYNIMVWKENPVFFDFGQAVLTSHPNADLFLERDVKNIVSFFKKRGVEVEATSVLAEILGC